MVTEELIDVDFHMRSFGGVKYCEGCGREWNLDKDICCEGCGWFDDNFNLAMKKYVELYKAGELGNHYAKVMRKKREGPRMNKKRMVFYLLKFKDGLSVNEKDIGMIFSHL